MIPSRPCADPDRLKGLLAGTLSAPEQADLNLHLETCARCQETLEELAGDKTAWSEMAHYLGQKQTQAARYAVEHAERGAEPFVENIRAGVRGDAPLDFLTPAKPGQLGRLGHYDILEVIGRGGMGVVLKAFDQKLQRVVAIKAMAPHLAHSASARKRFVREAQAAAAIRHEHVIDIYAVEEDAAVPYLVMEYISGVSLEERLERRGRPTLAEVLRIGMQTAAGLAAAHAQGLVHRDIKPANILLENGVERVKITDFGLARAVDDARLTQSGVVAGTPAYMAPEQADGQAVDHRSDLFSLGSVLYTLCTGRPPFEAAGALAVARSVCEDAPPPVRSLNPEAPEWLAALIAKLQAKSPARRFQAAAEVADLLGRHLAHLQQPGRSPLPTTGIGRGGRWVLAGAALAVVCIVGLALTEASGVTQLHRLFARQGQPPQGPPQVEPPRVQPPRVAPKVPVAPPLPPGEVRAFTGHTNCVIGVGFSPDGSRIFSGNWDGTVRTWHADTGQELRSWPLVGSATSIAFSADGLHAVSGGQDRVLRWWDMQTGKAKHALAGHKQPIWKVALSTDGTRAISGSSDRTARIWDLEAGREMHCLDGHTDWLSSVAYAPDGRHVATTSKDRTVRVWSVADGKEIKRFELAPNEGVPQGVAFAPDSRRLVVGSWDMLRLWDIESGKLDAVFHGHVNAVQALAFSPDGQRLISASNDLTVRCWDVIKGRLIYTLKTHTGPVLCLAYAPNGMQSLSAGDDKVLRLCQMPIE